MIDSRAVVAPATRLAPVMVTALAALAAPVADAAGATTPPPSTTVPPPSSAPLPLTDGVFADPDGNFTVRFAAGPSPTVDAATGLVTYAVATAEDTETVATMALTSFGAPEGAGAAARAELFVTASGADVEWLANSATHLGPFPAAYFIARLALPGGRRAVVDGAVVVREKDVSYVVYTDAGGDDQRAARTFVESYTVLLTPPPPPQGWLASFPTGVELEFRAAADGGLAYAEYFAVDGDDTLSVRIVELPAGYESPLARVPQREAARIGGEVLASRPATVGGQPAIRFTLAQEDSSTSGDTVELLVVDRGRQRFRIAYEDGGVSSADVAEAFITSFHLT